MKARPDESLRGGDRRERQSALNDRGPEGLPHAFIGSDKMVACLIGLGSNLGERRQTLDRAVARLQSHARVDLLRTSAWIETAPVGGPDGQPPFLNGALVAETSLSPEALLEVLHEIENALGRRRAERWGPRTVDLDLLLYGELVRTTPSLVLPHPRMAWRRFVLEPAVMVARSMVHPTTGWTIGRLWEHLDTTLPYVAVSGSIGAGKTRLVRQVAARTAARRIVERVDMARLADFYADPASQGWETELEFLRQRTRLLAADAPQWGDTEALAISDFWFDQSLAFARVWLSPEVYAEFSTQWSRSRREVVRPRLIVLLDVPIERLVRQVARRGRPCERDLGAEQLERIQREIVSQATQPNQGPLLRLSGDDEESDLREVLAAIEAMR